MEAKAIASWRDNAITPKQKKTIIKMRGILGWKMPVPEKKGPAADLISQMMKEAEKRIAITGSMGYRSEFDGYGMDEYDATESDIY
jgi:hypothetical protein